MSDVAMFTLAADDGGPWHYESALLQEFSRAGSPLSVDRVRTRNVRSPLPGELRLPYSRLAGLPRPIQLAATRVALARYRLIHRCDLRLPVSSREVLTIHDTAWLRDDDAPTPPRPSLDSVRRAAAVIAPSRFAAMEIATHLGRDDVVVALNGVDDAIADAVPLAADALARLGIDRPFVLCSGGNAKRKNLPALLDAWATLGSRTHQLAVTGAGARSVTAPQVVPLGLVTRGNYLSLLAAADAVVVPSRYEGFGLPALEGMAAGKPVLATNCASLPEVCGDAALITEPDAGSLAEGLHALLTDPLLRNDLQVRGRAHVTGFSWATSAEIHLRVYHSALAATQ